jgi:hypothetical protein
MRLAGTSHSLSILFGRLLTRTSLELKYPTLYLKDAYVELNINYLSEAMAPGEQVVAASGG